MALFSDSFNALRSFAGSLIWSPVVAFSRTTVLRLLIRIEKGQIVVRESDGNTVVCGGAQTKDCMLKTELNVVKDTFWVRALLFADMVRTFHPVPTDI